MSAWGWLKTLRLGFGSGAEGAVAGVVGTRQKNVLDVAVWAHERLLPARGQSTEVGRLHADYCAVAAKRGCSALVRTDFEAALHILLKHAGLKPHAHGPRAYVEDVVLSA